ncbi:hypothetical protein [Parabacteroides sp. ZJ-118]|uniref:HU family DNA-binding protein n=1 Tax=Parabacteroides sp. ZJ-118 TaxID=2709398 RepID=UPI0013EC2185|nr:hypothetical protein [Parabacteroides sp. ZJ-118]
MIKYVIQAKTNILPENKDVKYYPQIAPATPLTLAQITRCIEKRSTASSADVKAVLDALQNGNRVQLGDLGSFRLMIKANGVATAAEAKR